MKEFGLIIKLIVSIVCIMFFGEWIPEPIQRGLFTLSLFMKDTLIFFMPVIVFAFIFSCLSSFQKKAPLLIIMILGFVLTSNFLFTQFGYVVGDVGLPLLGYHATNAAQKVASFRSLLEPFLQSLILIL